MMLYGNTAKIDVTPSLGTLINGEFTSRYATKIADPLFAKGIYLHDRQNKVLIIVVDICVMKREFLDPVKQSIFNLTGIPVSNQLISSTHAHSTGSVADLLLTPVDVAYRELLAKKLLELAQVMVSKEEPIQVAFGKVLKPEHLTSRRYKMNESYKPWNPVLKTTDGVKTNPFGHEDEIIQPTSSPDPQVCYLGVKNLEGKWMGMLANYGLHYVGDCARSTVTADYFGYFSNKITALLGQNDMTSMMSNGTSGEVNIWDFRNPDRYPKGYHEKSKLIGEDVAQAVYASIDDLVWQTDASLDVLYQELPLRKRTLHQELQVESYKILAATDYETLHHTDEDLYEKIYAREQVLLQSVPDEILFPLQCIRIGKIIIGALGGEFFSQTGKALKKQTSEYFSVCLANDYVGYVPPAQEFENGGYETWRCRSSFLQQDAERKVLDSLSSMIKKIKQDGQ